MTSVTSRLYYDAHLLIIEGHAGSAEKGRDLVCAAISALAVTLVACLRDREADGQVILRRCVVRDGYVCVEAAPAPGADEPVRAVFETVVTGLRLLADCYPDYVRMD